MWETRTYTLGELARSSWTWPLPAFLVHALVLLGSSDVWTETITLQSKNGPPSVVPAAHVYLGVAAVLTLFYAGSHMPRDLLFRGPYWARGRLRPAPSQGEQKVLVGLWRGGALVALYYATWRLVSGYVLA